MKQHNSANGTLFDYLQHELRTPINSMVGYSELLLEKLDNQQAQPSSAPLEDLQKVRDCGQQLLTQVIAILDSNRLLLSQPNGDLNDFSTTLRRELITPLSAAIGYCELLLEEAPAELILEVENLNGSARQILSAINKTVHLAQQQVQAAVIEPAEAIAAEDFSFITLNDTVEPAGELSQSTHGFSLAAKAVDIKHFQQLQERDKGSLDIENLHRSSLYPPLSRQSAIESNWTSSSRCATSTAKIIAVHSFRGGTGKSNIASGLAMSLANKGKRVGIVDTDLLSPGMHVLFGLQDRALGRTLNDYLRGDCLLHEAALDMSHWLSRDTAHNDHAGEGAIYLVPASPKPSDIMRVVKERYEEESLTDGFCELIDHLNLDFLLIDTRSGISAETLQTIAVCSLLLVVLRPDYQDYQGTSIILELARMLSVEEMQLVVNKVLPTFDIDAYCQQLETTCEVPVSKILLFYEDVVQLASSEVFSVRYPHHPFTRAIDAMAQDIASSIELGSVGGDAAVASTMTML